MLQRNHLLVRAAESINLTAVTDQKFVSQFLAEYRRRPKPAPSVGTLTDEDVQRLSISTHSPENFFNKKKGVAEPSWVVSEAHEKQYSPTRFGDWEKNGRCMDF